MGLCSYIKLKISKLQIKYMLRSLNKTYGGTLFDEQTQANNNNDRAIIPYEDYDKYIESIDLYAINYSDAEIKNDFTSTEKGFLKSLTMHSFNRPHIPRYWYYTYGLDYETYIKIFLKNDLFYIVTESNLSLLTVAELKNLLKTKKISQTGKKADLIKKVHENFTKDEIQSIPKTKLISLQLTEKGKNLISDLQSSATHNLELEDECIALILNENYNAAYSKVCHFRASSPLSSGLGFDWNNAAANGWHRDTLDKSNNKMRIHSACVIFCTMMGISYRKADIIYKRITGEKYTLSEDEINSLSVEQFRGYTTAKINLHNLKTTGIKQYKILATCDTRTCKKCAQMDGKVFNVDDAIIGVNAPPFELDCRCCIVANNHIPNSKRRVRDETGHSILVPYMNYEEWSKIYAPDKYKEYFCNTEQ